VADRFEGKRLNSPNDLVVHPDGGIWFTDPVYGIGGLYEGMPAAPELKPAVYRIDPNDGSIVKVADEVGQPNGICFSPDYSKLYVADTGNRETKVWTVQGATLAAGQTFARIDVPGIGALAADGIRCDTDGNVWAATRVGVIVMAPDGVVIGLIRLPEHCGNLCFGGAKRNRLFVAASQSLYAVYVGAQGAHMA
jgi:gluconolactonase